MAARFWVPGGTGAWTSSTNWSATSGGSSGAVAPTTSDDVTFDSASGAGNYTVNMASGNCRNMTVGPPSSGTVTLSGTLTNCQGNINFTSNTGIAFALTTTTITCTGSGTNTITTSGLSLAAITLNGTGSWTLASNLTTTGAFAFTAGTFNDGGFTATIATFNNSSSSTRSLIITANWSVAAQSGTWSTTGFTFSQAVGSTITYTGNMSSTGWGNTTFTNVTFSSTAGFTSGVNITGLMSVNASASISCAGNYNVNSLNRTNWTLTAGAATFTIQGALPDTVTVNNGSANVTLAASNSIGGTLSLLNGVFSLGGFNFSAANFTGPSGATAATLTWTGSETFTLTGTGTVFGSTSSAFTVNAATGTLKTTNNSASSKTVSVATTNCTLPSLYFSGGAGTGAYIVTGGNFSVGGITMDPSTVVQTLTIGNGRTITLRAANLNISGNAAHQNILNSASAGTQGTLSCSAGVIHEYNVSIKDSAASGGATFNSWTSHGCVSTSNNSGWIFTTSANDNTWISLPFAI